MEVHHPVQAHHHPAHLVAVVIDVKDVHHVQKVVVLGKLTQKKGKIRKNQNPANVLVKVLKEIVMKNVDPDHAVIQFLLAGSDLVQSHNVENAHDQFLHAEKLAHLLQNQRDVMSVD